MPIEFFVLLIFGRPTWILSNKVQIISINILVAFYNKHNYLSRKIREVWTMDLPVILKIIFGIK